MDILDHTKNRAAGGSFYGDSADMQELVKLGLMYNKGKSAFCSDEIFGMTEAGQKALKEFKK